MRNWQISSTGKSISSSPGSMASPNPTSTVTWIFARASVAVVWRRIPPYSSSSRIGRTRSPSPSKVTPSSTSIAQTSFQTASIASADGFPNPSRSTSGGTVRILEPDRYEHCALQSESIAMLRDAESIQQSLEGIAGQYQIEDLTALTGQVHQLCANRCADITWCLTHA